MRIIITADIHNGAPGKLNDTIWAMDQIRNYANTQEISHVLVLGDLFHDRVNLNIEVINVVYDQLKQAKEDGQTWITFPGNHDCYLKNSWKINSLHILEGVIQVVEGIGIILDNIHILPFMHSEEEYMEALSKIQHNQDQILLTHIGVKGATLNECFLLKHWGVVSFENTQFKRIFAGHFHCYQEMGRVVYPGSPIPFRYDEGVVDHGFLVYDTGTDKLEFIKIFDLPTEDGSHPPDYLTIVDENLLDHIEHVPQNNIKIILSKEYTKNELNSLRAALTKRGAKSINWVLPKKEIEEASTVTNISQLKSPEKIFESWLDFDKPPLNKELLMTIHAQIQKEAEERVVIEEDVDA